MLRTISLKAILLPPVVAFALPFATISFVVAPLLGKVGDGAPWAGRFLFGVWVLLEIAAPFTTGFLGARLATVTQIFHGLGAGVVTLAGAVIVFSFHSITAGVLQVGGIAPETSLNLAVPDTLTLFIALSLWGATVAKRQRAVAQSAA